MLRLHVVMTVTLAILVSASGVMGRSGRPKPPKANAEEFIVPTREDFLRGLNLEKPELAAVKAALDNGDVEAAGEAYIAHFRAMSISSPLVTDWDAIERDPEYSRKSAERIVGGHWFDGYKVYDVPAAGADWHDGPLVCLCTLRVVNGLLRPAYHTEDPRYIRYIADHISQYMAAYPIEEFAGHCSEDDWNYTGEFVTKPWGCGQLCTRLQYWAEMMSLLRRYESVSDEELLTMLHRIYEETAFMRTQIECYVEHGGNHAGGMIMAMAASCAVLQDFHASDEWLALDAASLGQYLDQSHYPDGLHKELTIAYWASGVHQLTPLAYALRDAEGIAACIERVKAMATAVVGLAKPTGRIPPYGDMWCKFTPRETVYAPLVEVLEVPWLDTMIRGTEGPLPPFTVWPVPGQEQWSGYYTMRSGWDKDAKYLMIDCGPWGWCHVHGDRLSIVVTANGADFIMDPPSTSYHSNTPGAFISRQNPGFLHSTVTVDGVDEFIYGWADDKIVRTVPKEATEPLDNTWEHADNYSLFEGSWSFEPVKAANWTRRIVFADKSYWLLQDVVTADQETAAIEQNFQFAPEIEIEFQGNMTVATAPNGAKLALVPLAGGLKPELAIGDQSLHTTYWPDGIPKTEVWGQQGQKNSHGRGWTSRGPRHDKLYPAPAVTYVGQVELPATMTVALIPLAADQKLEDMPQITSHATEKGTEWTLPIDGGTYGYALGQTRR